MIRSLHPGLVVCRAAGHRRAPGPARTPDGERGSASLELIGVSLVLLVPLFYLVMTLARLQAASYAASGAARDAARVFVTTDDVGAARARAQTAARIVLDDYGVAEGGGVETVCLDDPCLAPDARVRAVASVRVALPLVPEAVSAVVPTSVTVHGDHVVSVDRFRGEPDGETGGGPGSEGEVGAP